MLKKENRLTQRFEYNVTKKYGEHYESYMFHMYALKARNYVGPAKVGFVISNKLSKKAVERNRVRRLFRESVRNNQDLLKNEMWLTFYPKNITINSTYEKINTEVVKTLQKIFSTN